MNARALRRFLRNTEGMSLLELLVAGAIFMFVVFALGSLFLSTNRAFDRGSAQAFVQRQGTLAQEELARQILPAIGLQVQTTTPFCGPTSGPSSLIFQKIESDGSSTFWCIYEFQDTGEGDTAPKLYLCQMTVTTLTPGACGSKQNLLAGIQKIRASNTTFTPGVTSATADIRFDLDLTDDTMFGPLRFGLTVTVRN